MREVATAQDRVFVIDGQYNVIGVANNQGQLPEAYRYNTYGTPVVLVGGSATQPYGFQGKRYGTYTGALRTLHVYDFRARAYDPLLGKFLQRDPAEYADGPDLYEAFRSNPLVYLDPSGTMTMADTLGASNLQLLIGAILASGVVGTGASLTLQEVVGQYNLRIDVALDVTQFTMMGQYALAGVSAGVLELLLAAEITAEDAVKARNRAGELMAGVGRGGSSVTSVADSVIELAKIVGAFYPDKAREILEQLLGMAEEALEAIESNQFHKEQGQTAEKTAKVLERILQALGKLGQT